MGMRIAGLVVCCLSLSLDARPISYSGGSTIMAFSDNTKHSVYFHYSPTYRYALGVEAVKDTHLGNDFSYLRFTYLLNRKNTRHSQRNLYFQAGASPEGSGHHFYGLQGDWETPRRWFAGFAHNEVARDDLDYSEQYIQLGVAPYLGEYGDLHTWLTLKTKRNTLLGDGTTTYPVLKFFKGNFFIELGYSDTADEDIHLMYRF